MTAATPSFITADSKTDGVSAVITRVATRPTVSGFLFGALFYHVLGPWMARIFFIFLPFSNHFSEAILNVTGVYQVITTFCVLSSLLCHFSQVSGGNEAAVLKDMAVFSMFLPFLGLAGLSALSLFLSVPSGDRYELLFSAIISFISGFIFFLSKRVNAQYLEGYQTLLHDLNTEEEVEPSSRESMRLTYADYRDFVQSSALQIDLAKISRLIKSPTTMNLTLQNILTPLLFLRTSTFPASLVVAMSSRVGSGDLKELVGEKKCSLVDKILGLQDAFYFLKQLDEARVLLPEIIGVVFSVYLEIL